MRTHPVDKLLEQHCHKSGASLLQLVRFYVCRPCSVCARLLSLLFLNTRNNDMHVRFILWIVCFWSGQQMLMLYYRQAGNNNILEANICR